MKTKHHKQAEFGGTSSPLLLETIRVEARRFQHITYHNHRFNLARHHLYGITERLDLETLVPVPGHVDKGVYKCRILYGPDIRSISFEPYTPKRITSLQLVVDDSVDYTYKFADRSALNSLFEKRGDCDDILIVKNGLLTDTSYANIALWDGTTWFTPSVPLLAGTARARMLQSKEITPAVLTPEALPGFQRIRIFNAMMDLDIPMENLQITGNF